VTSNPAYTLKKGITMNLTFENKVALVTGAASGMGLVTARAFAEAGAALTLADVNEKAVCSAAEELVAAGHKAIGIHAMSLTRLKSQQWSHRLYPPLVASMRRSITPVYSLLPWKWLMSAAKSSSA
jgi:NAD(P)-dependent dehydrogenase (short-subunit alcohol dehydrogenase family)